MFLHFFSDESGAITADWVVITSAVVGLGFSVVSVVSGGLEDLSADIVGELRSGDIIQATPGSASANDSETDYATFDFASYERTNAAYRVGRWNQLMGSIQSMPQQELTDMVAYNLALSSSASGNTDLQGWAVDSYAAGYGEMQRRGMDVSGHTHPQELIDDWAGSAGS